MAAFDGKVYVIGGLSDGGIAKKVDVFDPKTGDVDDRAGGPGRGHERLHAGVGRRRGAGCT